MTTPDATQRFSSRVENYVLHRPGYPPGVIDLLRRECELTPASVIADVASGTGIFTRLLLENGNPVFGVEPNTAMRRAGKEYLAEYGRFTSVAATAEATTLPGHSVDMVTAAQVAHWFNREQTHHEFARILKPGGWVVLLWNERRTDTTPFLRAYERLLQTYGTDYQEVRHEHTTVSIDQFFASSPFQTRVFENRQELDYPALEGRLLSSSYTPQEGTPKYQPMLRELRKIFDSNQNGGRVIMEYNTQVYYGNLA